MRYGDLAIFKMAAVRHLGFVVTSQYCIAGHIFVVQTLILIIIIIIQHLYSAIMSYADTEALVAPVKSE